MCFDEKSVTEFHRRGDGHQWWCKECRRGWDSAYHARTRDVRVAQTRAQKQRLVDWLSELKANPCMDCGGTFHVRAMTFDHRPGTEKVDDVSSLVRSGRARMARIEVEKCDLVCANCHAVRTFIRRQEARQRAPASMKEAAAPYVVAA